VALLKHLDRINRTSYWTGDESADLLDWLTALSGCPPITQARLLRCDVDDREFCGFVQADARIGVARRRCVACATATDLLDSAERWSFPDTYECPGCQQSLVELAVGISADGDRRAEWVALAARCVGCGRIAGLTDRLVSGLAVEELLVAV
jgi:hypothetical protein